MFSCDAPPSHWFSSNLAAACVSCAPTRDFVTMTDKVVSLIFVLSAGFTTVRVIGTSVPQATSSKSACGHTNSVNVTFLLVLINLLWIHIHIQIWRSCQECRAPTHVCVINTQCSITLATPSLECIRIQMKACMYDVYQCWRIQRDHPPWFCPCPTLR